MSKRHKMMSEGTISKLLYLRANLTSLTDWEQKLVADRFEALKKFQTKAVITPKQLYQLNKTFLKRNLADRIKKAEANDI